MGALERFVGAVVRLVWHLVLLVLGLAVLGAVLPIVLLWLFGT